MSNPAPSRSLQLLAAGLKLPTTVGNQAAQAAAISAELAKGTAVGLPTTGSATYIRVGDSIQQVPDTGGANPTLNSDLTTAGRALGPALSSGFPGYGLHGGTMVDNLLWEYADKVQVYLPAATNLVNPDLTTWTRTSITNDGTIRVFPNGLLARKSQTTALGAAADKKFLTTLTSDGTALNLSVMVQAPYHANTTNAFWRVTNLTAPRAGVIKTQTIPTGTGDEDVINFSILPTDGTTYQTGDSLQIELVLQEFYGFSAAWYVGPPTVTSIAAAWNGWLPTATARSAGWVAQPIATDYSVYQWSFLSAARNDAGVTNATSPDNVRNYRNGLRRAVSGALMRHPHVALIIPNPLASDGTLTAWGADASDVVFTTYADIIKGVAAEFSVPVIDLYTWAKTNVGTQAEVTAGTKLYTIAATMNDVTHLKAGGPGSVYLGHQQSALLLATRVANPAHRPTTLGGITAYYLGQPTGNWTTTRTDTLSTSSSGRLQMTRHLGLSLYRQSSTAGDTLTFSPTGQRLALLVSKDGTTNGSVTVTVDAGTQGAYTATVSTQQTGSTNNASAVLLGGSFAPGPHTVTVTVATGTPRIIGVLGVD